MVAEKNISDGHESGPQREETVLGASVNQSQQEFGSKMLNAPRIEVTALVICVYNEVLELYSDHQQCRVVPFPNPRLLSQQPLDQNPDLDEDNIFSAPEQRETSHAAGADAVFPMAPPALSGCRCGVPQPFPVFKNSRQSLSNSPELSKDPLRGPVENYAADLGNLSTTKNLTELVPR